MARTEKPHARRNAGCLSDRGGELGFLLVFDRLPQSRTPTPRILRTDIDKTIWVPARAYWNAPHMDADHKRRRKGYFYYVQEFAAPPHASPIVGHAVQLRSLVPKSTQVSPATTKLARTGLKSRWQ